MVKAIPLSAKIGAGLLILCIGVYMVVPLVVVAASSLSNTQFLVFPPQDLSLRWYEEVLSTDEYVDAFSTSFQVALAVMTLAVLIGTPAAIAITRFNFPGASFLSALFLSPMIIPMIILGISLLTFFSKIGSGPSLFTLILGHLVIALPYVIRTVSGVLEGADHYTEEAARTMGARWYERYWYVVLPICRPGVVAGAFFAFNISFDDAVVALFLRSPAVETLPLKIYSELEFNPNPSIAAVSTLMVLLTIVLVFVIERFLGLDKVVS